MSVTELPVAPAPPALTRENMCHEVPGQSDRCLRAVLRSAGMFCPVNLLFFPDSQALNPFPNVFQVCYFLAISGGRVTCFPIL